MQAQVVKSIAVNSGIVWSTQNWDYKTADIDFPSEYCTGFHIAAVTEFFQHKYLSLLTDIGYNRKGFKAEFPVIRVEPYEELGTMEKKFAYKYLYFSPQFKARMEFGNFIPYLFIGPRLDYQIAYPTEFSYPGWDYYNDLVLGMNYGLGIEYVIGPLGIGLIFHHQYDFMFLYDRQPSDDNTGLSIKNNALVLDLGVKFYFGKE